MAQSIWVKGTHWGIDRKRDHFPQSHLLGADRFIKPGSCFATKLRNLLEVDRKPN